MVKRIVCCLSVCLLLSGLFQARAQMPAPATAPKVLVIVREDIKPGKGADHAKQSNAFVQLLGKAKSPYYRVAAIPMSGNENEVTYYWGFDSYATLEKYYQDLEKWATGPFKAEFEKLDKQGADLHAAQRDVIASYREDLSYRPKFNVGEAHYMIVVTIRARPGHGMDFTEARKIVLAAHERAKLEEHYYVYEASSGTPGPTYFIFVPLKSLKEMDADIHGKAYQDTVGEENQKKLAKIAADSYLSIESSLYAFNPSMSYVGKDWAAGDPDFWWPKKK